MKFSKWQGCGNDFVIVDFLDHEPVDFAVLAREMCDRHFGVGADGLMAACPSETADVRMREFNPDGTEPEDVRKRASAVFRAGSTKRDT